MGKRIQIKTEKENGIIVMAFLVMTCILAKILQLYYLPAKYTYDGRRILSETLSGHRSGDLGYDTTENFFAILVKWFHIETYEQWSILLGLVGSILVLRYIRKYLAELYLTNAVFLVCSLVLLNIYTFNISKEILQMIMFLPAFYGLNRSGRRGQFAGVLGSILVVSLFLRQYFFLIMIVFLVIYILFRNAEYLEGNKTAVFFIGLVLIGVVGLAILERYLPEVYKNILEVRSFINQFRMESSDASTIIVDVIKNSVNPWIYICNLAINFFRLCFPVELLSMGPMQAVFVVYQIILSIKIAKALFQYIGRKAFKGQDKLIAVSFILAYLVVSAVFEPDFGSFTRHEIVFFPIFCIGLMGEYEESGAEEGKEFMEGVS